MVSETRLVVRYAETDRMGIVHHSNYPVWYEAGRTDFIKQAGVPYSRMEEGGILLPLIELRCCYKSFSLYEDEIIVRTRIKDMTPTRITFSYEVLRNNEPEPINTGETMHVYTNKDLKPVNLKKHAPEIFQLLYCLMEGH